VSQATKKAGEFQMPEGGGDVLTRIIAGAKKGRQQNQQQRRRQRFWKRRVTRDDDDDDRTNRVRCMISGVGRFGFCDRKIKTKHLNSGNKSLLDRS
jgi:hypothetical protein